MKFFIRYSVLLVAVCVLVGQVSARRNVLFDFMKTFNGLYTNNEQITHVAPGQPIPDAVKITFIPLKLKKLWEPVIYFEEALNGEVKQRELWVLRSDKIRIITFRIYNITFDDKSRGFDRDAAIAALGPKDLHGKKDCVGTFLGLPNGWFTGGKPDCTDDYANGNYPIRAGVDTCNSMIFNYPPIVSESTPFMPIVVKPEGDRYPVPGMPASYSNPCDSNNQ